MIPQSSQKHLFCSCLFQFPTPPPPISSAIKCYLEALYSPEQEVVTALRFLLQRVTHPVSSHGPCAVAVSVYPHSFLSQVPEAVHAEGLAPLMPRGLTLPRLLVYQKENRPSRRVGCRPSLAPAVEQLSSLETS